MKKISPKSVFMIFLVGASLASYVYLNSVSPQNDASSIVEETEEAQSLDKNPSEVALPDLLVLKKLAKAVKHFVPGI